MCVIYMYALICAMCMIYNSLNHVGVLLVNICGIICAVSVYTYILVYNVFNIHVHCMYSHVCEHVCYIKP